MKRKLLSLMLTIGMLVSMFPTTAWASINRGRLYPYQVEHNKDCSTIVVDKDTPYTRKFIEDYVQSYDKEYGLNCKICDRAQVDKFEKTAEILSKELIDYSEDEHVSMTVETALSSVYSLEGDGTSDNPYKVSSREDLETIADAVNGGNTLQGVYFKQTCDLQLGGQSKPWPVIGHVIGNTPHPFDGIYNGNDFKIYGLFVGTTDEDGDPMGLNYEDAGLFGHIGENGIIQRVHVVDCQVYSKALYVGGITGRNEGLVEYCSSQALTTDPTAIASGVINGKWQYAGGIVGYNFGTISYCYSNCDIYGAQKVGGITGGQNGGTVVNCYFRGYVYADDITRAYAGGIAGENDGNSTIDNCYCDGLIEGYNENAYCGYITGSNDTGSTVENCFWEDSDNTDLPGIGSGMGDSDKVERRTEEEFASGQVAWELAHGTNGKGWGQNVDSGFTEDGTPYDKDWHPHFVDTVDKDYPTTPVYRVTLKAPLIHIDEVLYVDPVTDIKLDSEKYKLPENSRWYLVDENGDGILDENGEPQIFNGDVTDHDVNAVGGQRISFGAEKNPDIVTTTYTPLAQNVEINLDDSMKYAERGPETVEGRFEYRIIGDSNHLKADLNLAGTILTIPENTNAGEYTLTVLAQEKKPFIAPLALGFFDTDDVELTLTVVIEKATPVINPYPKAMTIDYGKALSFSLLSGGEARHPSVDTIVNGRFTWTDENTIPTVNAAAITGYPVLFTPDDNNNYNSVTLYVPLTVNKVDSFIVTTPSALGGTYSGTAQELINAGSATGGEMKYWLTDDLTSKDPDQNAVYSSTVPSRANAGTYRVWYMVIGDENHKDSEPAYIDVTIDPYPLSIPAQEIIYDGTNILSLTVDGVMLENGSKESITLTLTVTSKNAGNYTYNSGVNKYTIEIASPNDRNYRIEAAGDLTIKKRPVILDWSPELVFVYEEGQTRTVSATVTNLVEGDDLTLSYQTGTATNGSYAVTATNVGNYIGKVSELNGTSSENYTLEGAINTEQIWHIVQAQSQITLEPTSPTYGEPLKLTANELTPGSEVSFYANGQLLNLNNEVTTDDNGKAVLEVTALSINHLTAGANPVIAVYRGNSNIAGSAAYATANISPEPISARITGITSKVYDGDNIATGLQVIPNGVEECDKNDVTASADSYTYNDQTANESKKITANNVTLSGVQSRNYIIDDEVSTDGAINPKPVKLEWRGISDRVYDGTPSNVTATATELIPGDLVTVEVEEGKNIDVGTYKATAKSLSDPINYKLPDDNTTSVTYEITPAPLYIPEQKTTYKKSPDFDEVLDGVALTGETVRVHIITSSPNAGSYDYAKNLDDGMYIASEDSNNYEIDGGARITIEKAVPDVTWPKAADNIFVNDHELTPEDFTDGCAKGVDKSDLSGTFMMTGDSTWNQKGSYPVSFTFIPDDSTNYIDVTEKIPVKVVMRQVASAYKKSNITHKYYGTAEEDLELPATVSIITKDGKVFEDIPVKWQGYNPYTLAEQNLDGDLDLSDIKDEVENPDNVKAGILVKLQQDPKDQTDPKEPDKPTGPNSPAKPDKPASPNPPANPNNSTSPDNPTKPNNPTNPGNPTKPDDLGDKDNSTGSDSSTKPDESADPDKPTNPNNSTNPNNPAKPDSPTASDNPTKSNSTAQPDKPTGPTFSSTSETVSLVSKSTSTSITAVNDSPETGNESNIGLWFLLAGISGTIFIVLSCKKRTKKQENN